MVDESERGRHFPSLFDMSIWKFYEWGVVLAPVIIMLSHWYIFYVFSKNTQEVMKYSESNEICIAWIYSIVYLYVPLMILPASYFFKWCSLFRIPFAYFLFINVERVYYGSWFCTNEMIDTHYILIYCILMMYAFALVELLVKRFRGIRRHIRKTYGT